MSELLDAMKNVDPYDKERHEESAKEIGVLQAELEERIATMYPIEADMPENVKKILHTTLGTILISAGLKQILLSEENPADFLLSLCEKIMERRFLGSLLGAPGKEEAK